jgi:ribonuclease-3
MKSKTNLNNLYLISDIIIIGGNMKLLEDLDIIPRDISLYERAFLHSSYCNENGIKDSYERLEFLGDKVIDLIISEYLYKHCNAEEGMMTKIRAAYVCENALYEYALKLNFNDYVKVGKGEELSGGKNRKTILADIFESFVGALYLDLGLNMAKKFLNKIIISNIEKNNEFFNDYKSMLQELVQTDKKSVEYVVTNEAGPAHNKTFTVDVIVDNIIYGTGTAGTKKEAEQNAAKAALDKQAKI